MLPATDPDVSVNYLLRSIEAEGCYFISLEYWPVVQREKQLDKDGKWEVRVGAVASNGSTVNASYLQESLIEAMRGAIIATRNSLAKWEMKLREDAQRQAAIAATPKKLSGITVDDL